MKAHRTTHKLTLGLGDMTKNVITIHFFTSVKIDNYHDKCRVISFKFKVRFLLLQVEESR